MKSYKFEIDFIVHATGGTVVSAPNKNFKNYSTDNRDKAIAETLFIPLVGESHDAHKYVRQAVEAGATGVLFHQWDNTWESLKDEASFIQVENTLEALQKLATAWRGRLSAKVIGLTGSNGKTTTKDFLFQLLSEKGKTFASKGSFNNHWGVPFTLLDTDLDAQFCVVEMGMNHPGELTDLNQIAKPNIVTVTNVGRAHMGHFEKGLEGVAEAKKEIYSSAPKAAYFVFNVDSEWTRKMYSEFADHPAFTFSRKNFSTDIYFKIKNKTSKGYEIEGQIGGVLGKAEVYFWGEHNVENLAAAVTLAYVAGMSPKKLWATLSQCHTGWGRNQWVNLENGAHLLFDGYNANPDSFSQLFKNLQENWEDNCNYLGVFGEMLELGQRTEEEHRNLGEKAANLNWEKCLFIGPSGASFKEGWERVKSSKNLVILDSYKQSLDLNLPSMINDQSQVIVKGSRGGALERVVERLNPMNFSPKK